MLDPILFLIYINNISNSSDCVHFTMYTDDTSSIVTNSVLQVLHTKLSRELDNVSDWIKVNMLKLNVNKTWDVIPQ